MQDRFTLGPPRLAFRFVTGNGQEAAGHDFFTGITLQPGGPARRELPPVPAENADLLQRTARKHRHVQAILEQADRIAVSTDQLLAEIDELTRDLDEDRAGQILYQLGDQQYRTGKWPLAAEMFQSLAQRYPQHRLTAPALLWLLQYYASTEAAWRARGSDVQKRFERAVALGREIERTRPELFAEPALAFSLAAAYRGLGQPRQAERLYQTQGRNGDRDPWSACAQGELRLGDPKVRSTRPILMCVRAEAPPRLDARLDDAVWQRAKPAAVQSQQHDDADWPAVVMLAYDAEFLYLAAHCRTVPAARTPKQAGPASPRTYDADLSAHDRIEVLIDVDRDYATYYRLAVNDRGWTNDSCWTDSTWNPKWSVAARREGDGWTFESGHSAGRVGGPATPAPRRLGHRHPARGSRGGFSELEQPRRHRGAAGGVWASSV